MKRWSNSNFTYFRGRKNTINTKWCHYLPADRLCKFAARHWYTPSWRGTGSGQATSHWGCPCRSGQSSAVDIAGGICRHSVLNQGRPRWGGCLCELCCFLAARARVAKCFYWLPESQRRWCCRRAEFPWRWYCKMEKKKINVFQWKSNVI